MFVINCLLDKRSGKIYRQQAATDELQEIRKEIY